MTTSSELQLGEVRRPKDRDDLDYRIIAICGEELRYDGCYHVLKHWTFSSARGRCYYQSLGTERMLRETTHVRHEPLTQEERAKFRPDLPLSFMRSQAASWGFAAGCDRAAFAARVKTIDFNFGDFSELAAPQIKLYAAPLTSNSDWGTRCHAENGRAFSAGELLWHGHEVQAAAGKRCKGGIGFFRMGHEKGGVPSFLVGGCNEMIGLSEIAEPSR